MTRSLSPMRLGYSILAGPILWFVHFILVYTIAEFGCRANFNNFLFITPANIRVVIVAITIPILIFVGIGGIFAYREWTRLKEGRVDSKIAEREHFLVIMAMLLSLLFLFSILVTTMPTFVVNVCDRAI